jgi:hypothetical protein
MLELIITKSYSLCALSRFYNRIDKPQNEKCSARYKSESSLILSHVMRGFEKQISPLTLDFDVTVTCLR